VEAAVEVEVSLMEVAMVAVMVNAPVGAVVVWI